jgi:hypothetical protein
MIWAATGELTTPGKPLLSRHRSVELEDFVDNFLDLGGMFLAQAIRHIVVFGLSNLYQQATI